MDLAKVETILEGKGAEPFDVMEVLQDIQEEYGYLPEAALKRVAEKMDIPLIEVFRLANFYKAFSLKPRGRHLITVCLGTACHVQGAPKLVDEVLGFLQLRPGETTKDGAFTVETVNCVGACALAPVLILDGVYYDHVTPRKLHRLIEKVRKEDEGAADRVEVVPESEVKQEILRQEEGSYKQVVTMCAGTACQACGCRPVAEAMRRELAKNGLTETVRFRTTGCHGFCEQGPLLIVEPGNIFYRRIGVGDIEEVVSRTLLAGETIERLLYVDPVSGRTIEKEHDIPFYAAQDRVLLGDNQKLDPQNIEDYVVSGGYSALTKVLQSAAPEEVIETVKISGLRGRGGGGYATGRKWAQCRNAEGDQRYVICNADEGDPGAYMDRSILEGNPHSVLEGMLIGAYAVGASQGFVYVRKEYPLAVKHISGAIEQARKRGLLGENILGSAFSFDVKVVRGGGAFVCGESTALMASLEGRVGEPRAKDVHTVEKGYLEKPTVLNNVETWANIPKIILNGANWFAAKGTEGSKGTKIFALTGQVKNTGLVEVAMGTTLRDIIFGIGGGPKDGRRIKAVQTGGPSGGCLPESEFDLPVDFDTLSKAGSMVGSGGMVVLDDSACMVDVAKYFLTFLQDESCGKCVTCRLGVSRMLEIVTDISEGRGSTEQLDLLDDLAWTVSVGSLCALGKTAPNPVLSTLKYFREEYEAHIHEKRCPAAVCRALIRYTIDDAVCSKCGMCAKVCPYTAISGDKESGYTIGEAICTRCGICMESCKPNAISKG